MIVTFALTACFSFLFWLRRKMFNRKDWTVVVAFSFLVSLVLAFISVWNVWTPYVTNLTFHGGDFDGCFPWSSFSYPLHLSVYHTPFIQLLYNGMQVSGNASFTLFLVNLNVIKVDGEFTFAPVYGEVPLHYSLNFPLFNSGERFVIFLLTLFALFNLVGAALGILITSKLLKRESLP